MTAQTITVADLARSLAEDLQSDRPDLFVNLVTTHAEPTLGPAVWDQDRRSEVELSTDLASTIREQVLTAHAEVKATCPPWCTQQHILDSRIPGEELEACAHWKTLVDETFDLERPQGKLAIQVDVQTTGSAGDQSMILYFDVDGELILTSAEEVRRLAEAVTRALTDTANRFEQLTAGVPA